MRLLKKMNSWLLPVMVCFTIHILVSRERRHAGIWDCLTSQQVVDFVRLKVSEGKDLTEISEMICDHCLAPDTSSGAGIGCDNMTVLIVAILGGRTKEEWYSWITDRVKQNYGYQTPTTVPQIYAHSQLMAFKAGREAQEERERMRAKRDNSAQQPPPPPPAPSQQQPSPPLLPPQILSLLFALLHIFHF
jgi:hypothetical protein